MATSSQDQPTTVNTSQNQVRPSRSRLWPRLLIAFIVFVLIIIIISIILVILTYTKILPPQWFVPLLTTLGPVFGCIGAYVNTTFSDKDVQQALKKRLIGTLSGQAEDKTSGNKESKDAAPQATTQPSTTITVSPTINISPTITNTNTGTSTADAASQARKEGLPHSPETVINPALTPLIAQLPAKSPFLVSTELTDPNELYGRAIERTQLLSRTLNKGCTSIIGPRRSGKTWLMTYLRQVAAQQLGANFCIGHVIATMPSSSMTIAGFCRETVKALGYPLYSLPERPDLTLLENVVRGMVAQNNTPILCIDEFESLIEHPECNLQFFEGLRAITQIGLVLVVISQKPLIEIVSQSTRTSPFFNVFLQLPLAHFDREDAERFWQEKCAQAQFTIQECENALTCSQTDGGQFPPLLLQLVGNMLWHEKYVADPVAQQRYCPNGLEYWQAFKQRVDIAYSGMVRL